MCEYLDMSNLEALVLIKVTSEDVGYLTDLYANSKNLRSLSLLGPGGLTDLNAERF